MDVPSGGNGASSPTEQVEVAMARKTSFDDVRWEYRHLIWSFIPPKSDKDNAADVIEAVNQYGSWYHVVALRDASIMNPDALWKQLRSLDKLRMGSPVQVKLNVSGGIWEGKYKR